MVDKSKPATEPILSRRKSASGTRLRAVSKAAAATPTIPDLSTLPCEEATRLEREQILDTLAHELRNPLHALTMALHSIDDAVPPSSRAKAAWGVVRRQLQQLGSLVDELLEASRLVRGGAVVERARLDYRRLVRDEVLRFEADARATGRHVILELGRGPLHVLGDARRLRQMLSQLLGNSLKYTSEGGNVDVSMRRETDADARPWLVLRVIDDGSGIPHGMLRHVFDLFVQVNPSVDRSAGGLGLGLSVVRQTALLHDGEVEARAREGEQGTEIVVRLPALPVEPRGAAAMTMTRARRPQKSTRLRVVVVEDNDDARDLMTEILRQWGHEVHGASRGDEGIALIAEQLPDVALVDVGLPVLDGYEVTRRARAIPGGSGVRFIAMSGYSREQRRVADAGFDAYLVKPVDLDGLHRILEADAVTHPARGDEPVEAD